MPKEPVSRYNNIAISLHWLMAFLIVGMLIVGKYLHQLEPTDPLRFELTQWHKTFGILILFLAVGRLLWRLTHKSPSHPANAPKWEHVLANISHFALYALMFIAPITGWMLVSVSTLNIDTLLFNVIPWPHLPWLPDLADRESAESLIHEMHEMATGVLIVILLLHIAGALKHHFVDKDTVLTRMSPNKEAGTGKTMFTLFAVLGLGIAGAVIAYAQLSTPTVSLKAGNSAVSAVASIMGEATEISFPESTVTASIDPSDLPSSSLSATVETASVTSTNLQVQGPLPDADWFDSATHPQATFISDDITGAADGSYLVTGTLSIKGIDQKKTFTLSIQDTDGNKKASGEFTIDRSAYQLGLESQPNDDYVSNDVVIAFEFSLSE